MSLGMGKLVAVVGLLANNFAFMSDLIFQDMGGIVMGPKSWALAAVGFLAVLVGLWMMAKAADEPATTSD